MDLPHGKSHAIPDPLPALAGAIRHVASCQLPSGAFPSRSGADPADPSAAAETRITTFFASTILISIGTALQHIDHAGLALSPRIDSTGKAIMERGTSLLLRERSPQWSFNYWTLQERTRGVPAYPDDADDTYAAFAALILGRPSAIDGSALAGAAKILMALETSPGGPYRTWLIPPERTALNNVPDPAVNATIGYFLALRGIHAPGLHEYLLDAVRQGDPSSAYYPSLAIVLYLLSRYLDASATKDPLLRNDLMGSSLKLFMDRSRAPSFLEQAALIAALVRCDALGMIPVNSCDAFIADAARTSWPADIFCADPSRDRMRCYAGSSALTAAITAEALAGIAIGRRRVAASEAPPRPIINSSSFHALCIDAAHAAFSRDPAVLREAAFAALAMARDPAVTEPVRGISVALSRVGRELSPHLIQDLGTATLYGWATYNLYDDLMDGDGHPSPLLPAANALSAKMAGVYSRIACATRDLRIMEYFDRTIAALSFADLLDPSRRHGADRSAGFALAPAVAVMAAGIPGRDHALAAIASVLRHYCAARQLHDDAHDWERDLARGEITAVTSLLTATSKGSDVPLPSLPALREIFWRDTIGRITTAILCHIDAARKIRDASPLLRHGSFMEVPLEALREAARRALNERDDALGMLRALFP